MSGSFTTEAPGVHRVTAASTNLYVVEDEDGPALVDAGLPAMRGRVERALSELGHGPGDVRAILLTHGHFDHLGVAAWLHETYGTPLLVHPGDTRIVHHPYRYRTARNRFGFVARHPRGWPHLAAMTRAGALWVKGVKAVQELGPGPVPGFPCGARLVPTPGHTDGHCVVHLPGLSTVLTGDALVTLDPYTGRRGPRVIATSATFDPEQALASLEAIASTGADLVLPGHGKPWRVGAAEAARAAREAGIP